MFLSLISSLYHRTNNLAAHFTPYSDPYGTRFIDNIKFTCSYYRWMRYPLELGYFFIYVQSFIHDQQSFIHLIAGIIPSRVRQASNTDSTDILLYRLRPLSETLQLVHADYFYKVHF